MAKLKLTARTVETAPVGKHSDALTRGLYLHVAPGGTAKWIFRFRWHDKQREMGLGAARAKRGDENSKPIDPVSLADAREAAQTAQANIRKGIDPIAARDAARAKPVEVVTFLRYAEQVVPGIVSGFSNPKHAKQWMSTIRQYCGKIHKMAVDKIDVSDVAGVLRPIWDKKPETAGRVRGRIERILDAATAERLRQGQNPAAWKGVLQPLFTSPAKRLKKHHAAMDYADVPKFMTRLRRAEGLGARALELTILAATRSTETLSADIPEFDIAAAVWTIPAERMKARVEHRVPLSAPALALVKKLLADRGGQGGVYLFPGAKRGRPLSNMAMSMTLRRLDIEDATTHGFRSSFRDWAGDQTTFPREIAEAALAHAIKDKAEAAYRRSDAIERRRILMQQWADFCTGVKADNVIPLRQAGGGAQ